MKEKFDLEDALSLLKEWWKTDLDIEIEVYGKERGVLIFAPRGHWTYGNLPQWNFTGMRYLAKPDKEYMSKKFKEKFEDYFGENFTLDEAINFVEDYYNDYI